MMNEFTKEELVSMGRALVAYYCDPRNTCDDELVTKIQSMINNYDAKVVEAWHCEKCGHVQ